MTLNLILNVPLIRTHTYSCAISRTICCKSTVSDKVAINVFFFWDRYR